MPKPGYIWSEDLRDQFAMAALPALIRTVNDAGFIESPADANRQIAHMAYDLADAMLAQREKGKRDARSAA